MSKNVEVAYTKLEHEADTTRSDGAQRNLRTTGWRGTVAVGSLTATAVLAVNLAVLIWTAYHFELQYGTAVVFEGSCSTARHISTWTHLAINTLSSLLLAACNSGMQVLSAPTRAEIDRAHAERRFLDVGVHTLRNLASIDRRRLTLWALLGLSSVPLHLLYNSVVFEISTGSTFTVTTVGKDFETGGYWSETQALCLSLTGNTTSISDLQADIGGLVRLDNAACIAAYGLGITYQYANLLAVSSDSSERTTDSVLNYFEIDTGGGDTTWMCDVPGNTGYQPPCDLSILLANAANWTLPGLAADGSQNVTSCADGMRTNYDFPISHCLAQPAEQHCKLAISVAFLSVVLACNAIKVACLAIAVWKMKFDPLVTVGDAIASFLDRPDITTEGYCLLSGSAAARWMAGGKPDAMAWKPKTKIGFNAASTRRWLFCSALFVAFWALALCLLIVAIRSAIGVSGVPLNFRYMRSIGLGRPFIDNAVSETWYQYPPWSNLGSLAGRVLVANLPQLLLSTLYMLYNDLFTRMQLAREWLSFARARKSLRVTSPQGEQRSTRFLQLPFIYAIPLLAAMTVLHWLVSQSVFLVLVNTYDYSNGGSPQDKGLNIVGIGFSPYGIILSLTVGAVMILTLWLYASLLRYLRNMPLAGSCSAAISAACHKPQWDRDAARKKLMWGVVSEDATADIGHVAFSSGDVGDLTPGIVYAGIRSCAVGAAFPTSAEGTYR